MLCQLTVMCDFFQGRMKDAPATADIIKAKYCEGDNTNCARFLIFNALGRERIPIDLFPNQKDRAIILIEKG